MHFHSQTLQLQLPTELPFKFKQHMHTHATCTDNASTAERSEWRTCTQGISPSCLKAVRWKKQQGVSVDTNKRQGERDTFKDREVNDAVHAPGLPILCAACGFHQGFHLFYLFCSLFFSLFFLFEVTFFPPIFFFFREVKILIVPDHNLAEWNAFVQETKRSL